MAGKTGPPTIRLDYWAFVKSEAALVGTDGCSAVSGLKIECCYEHDLAYRYKKDPRDAFRLYRAGRFAACWLLAQRITRAEADMRLRQCLMNHSKLGRYSPMAWWRWLGVRIGARHAWRIARVRMSG